MLVFARREDEKFWVGDALITIVRTDDGYGKVKIGIEAPPEIQIWRDEILDQADRARRMAELKLRKQVRQ